MLSFRSRKGGHFDWKHIQPIEQIRAEGHIRYGGVQVAIRGSDNGRANPSEIWRSDAGQPAAGDRVELSMIECVQELSAELKCPRLRPA